MNRSYSVLLGALTLSVAATIHAEESIEFVAEHLPEAAMDNRFATLPIWNFANGHAEGSSYQLQGAFSSTGTGNLTISGPMLSLSLSRPFGTDGQLGAFGFYDPLQLSASHESRPLQTLFAPQTPIERPVAADFYDLDGTATDFGGGLYWSRHRSEGWLGEHNWVAGLMWQRVDLKDYRFDYRIAEGPQTGLQGRIDFDAHYDHFSPFVGLQLSRSRGDWTFTPHALIAYPLPRRGFQGHVVGPSFDIAGDTADVGNGKHFGDPSVTLGLTLTYTPAHLSIDAGTLLSQALLEQRIHKGIDSNWLLSFSWTP